MSEETGALGHGSAVRIGRIATAPPIDWSELELVGDLEAPDDEVDDVQTTHQKSPGRRRQYIAGLIDSGDVTIPHNHIPGSPTDLLLKAIRKSRETVLVEITLGEDGEPETWEGYLKSYGRAAPIDDKMTANAVFRLSALVEED